VHLRAVPLQFFPYRDDLIVVAANSGMPSPPGWYFNLKTKPTARVQIGSTTLDVRAEELASQRAAASGPGRSTQPPTTPGTPNGPATRSPRSD
jgi:deazaflavin-dependent oxidoreductase (nitroreductase family)